MFIIFVPVEREINTLQYTYLQSWLRHNCVTLHVTKVYFMELKMNIGQLYRKTSTFIWIIYNSGVSWSIFYTFSTNGNRNEYSTKNEQNLQHHPNCVSTLSNIKTSHFETTVADRFIECVRSNPFVCNFRRKPSNVHRFNFFVQYFLSVFWQKICYIFTGFWSRFYLQTLIKTQYI